METVWRLWLIQRAWAGDNMTKNRHDGFYIDQLGGERIAIGPGRGE